MTGPQFRTIRESRDLTLREVAESILDGDVTHTTVSRWESEQSEIPKWAEDKMLASTKLHFSLAELHDLLDIAREEKISFLQLLGDSIREHLARRRAAKAPINYATATPPAHLRVAEASTRYQSNPIAAPATDPAEPPTRAALRAAVRLHLASQTTDAPPPPPSASHHRSSAPPPAPSPTASQPPTQAP